MFNNKALENIGIEVVQNVEAEKVIDLAKQISEKMFIAFPNTRLNYLEMHEILVCTPMYYAKISNGLSKANYYYKNSSLYFDENVELLNIDEYIFHECIHRLQEHKDKKGNITRIGLCEINELTVKGTALNEGAVQYVVSKALELPQKEITIYGITINGKTEYYPLITNIISQLGFLLGEDILIDSTINSNENFKIEIIDNIGESEYNLIEKNTNEILNTKNSILELQKNNENISIELEEKIQKLYFETQNLIYTTYFNKILKRVENVQETNVIKRKLEEYKNLIGINAKYNDFNEFYEDFNKRANAKIDDFMNRKSLIVLKDNFIIRIFKRIKKLFTNSPNEYYK